MKKRVFPILFTLISSCLAGSLLGQLDPATMATLSQLSPEQRKELAKKYGGNSPVGNASTEPSTALPNLSVDVEAPQEESIKQEPTSLLLELQYMEEIVSEDLSRLQKDEDNGEGEVDYDLKKEISENQALLQRIQILQRQELEKRTEEFTKSQSDLIKPFGYDLFASDPSTFAPGNEVPIPSDYRIGPGDMIDVQLFGQRNDSLAWIFRERAC